jgi:hypothetical protein
MARNRLKSRYRMPGVGVADILSRDQMIGELRALVAGRPLRRCAREWGVSHQEIHAVLVGGTKTGGGGGRYPGDRLLAVLGLKEADMMYVRVRRNEAGHDFE